MFSEIRCRPVLCRWVTALITVLLKGLPAWCRAYQIGYTSITFVDADRGGRQVPTQIYYPSDTAAEGDPAAWADFQAAIDTLSQVTYQQACPSADAHPGDEGPGDLTAAVSMIGASPNPFTEGNHFCFALRRSAHVKLGIFSADGRLVDRLVDDVVPAGSYTLRWAGRDRTGCELASGVYFYRLVADGRAFTGRLVLTR